MIIIMHPEATPSEIDNVVAEVEAKGWQTHRSSDHGQTIIGLQGQGQPLDLFQVGQLPGVLDALAITQKVKLIGMFTPVIFLMLKFGSILSRIKQSTL